MKSGIESNTFKKVMIIDDNETDRYVAERILGINKFAEQIILMETAELALSYLQTHSNEVEKIPQLIFLDIRMPLMDGFEFLVEYEKLPVHIKSKCIVLMLSTSLISEDQEKAEANSNVYKFLNKPLAKDKLQELKQLFFSNNNI